MRPYPLRSCRLFLLNSITLALFSFLHPASAKDEFNLHILELGTPLENTSTLETFLQNNGLQPGTYLTEVVWDYDRIDKRNITYVLSQDKTQLLPQFSKGELRELGVKVDSLPGLKSLADTAPVGDIAQYISGAKFDFQLDSQTLFMRIPQIYRDQQVAGAIPIKDWDDGIPAAWSSYYISGNRQQVNGENDNSNWASLNSGLNLGA